MSSGHLTSPETEPPSETDEVDSGIRRVKSWPPREGAARYQGGALLGRGGVGEVRACEDLRVRRTVAMKTLVRDADDSATVARFLDEARLQARLEHPAVVPVYDLGANAEGVPFFTMKRVRGVTLHQVLTARRAGEPTPYSTRKLLNAYVTVCLAMEYAHRCGVVHGDLKPDNVMLGRFGEVHVLDWGCAARADATPDDAALHPSGRSMNESVDGLVLSGLYDGPQRGRAGFEIVGTPGYLAPEQARGLRGDRRSDVYALGAILFEILAGEPLHGGPTALSRVVRTMETPTERPSKRAPDIDIAPELDHLVALALAFDPAARPSAQQLASRIEAHLDDEMEKASSRRSAQISARLAVQHAERATRIGNDADRAEALRSAGHALSLDPNNQDALLALERVLSERPTALTEDAQAVCAAADAGLWRGALSAMSGRAWGWLATTVPALMLGVQSRLAAGIALGAIALAAGVFEWHARRPQPSPFARYVVLGLATLAVAVMSGLFGPLVLTPVFATTTAALLATGFRRTERLWVCIACLLAIVVPLMLELSGVVPPSMAFVDGTIVLLPRVVAFPPGMTAAFLAVSTLASIPLAVVLGARLRDAVDRRIETLAMAESDLRRALPSALGARLRASLGPTS